MHQTNFIESDTMVISDYYKSIPYVELKAKFRDEVIKRIGITRETFYVKLRKNKWRPGEREIIQSIIDRCNADKN